ncbi:hypothetical protein BIW11_12157 [Tropilaelaps mercedesae]|uniref:Tudor domain-containing protein n=1 Tax=Tropilaelaps mercedesae TaxID=418985 RepID=A0A1V9X869_9ACAR|nr:hypothetical protein BIW11_12157 [Tropilaelaps mercedesae]
MNRTETVIITCYGGSSLSSKSHVQYGAQPVGADRKIKDMEEQLEELYGRALEPHSYAEAGDYVMLLFDNVLCRGFVTEVLSPDCVRVLYIDYGNYAWVATENVYRLDSDKVITQPWMTFQCILANDNEELLHPNEKYTLNVRARFVGPDTVPVYLVEPVRHGHDRAPGTSCTVEPSACRIASTEEIPKKQMIPYGPTLRMNAVSFLLGQIHTGTYSLVHVIKLLTSETSHRLHVTLELCDGEYSARIPGLADNATVIELPDDHFNVQVVNRVRDLTVGEIVLVRAVGQPSDDGPLPVILLSVL